MVSAKLLSSIRELNRADKLYIVQVLISELAQTAKLQLFNRGNLIPFGPPAMQLKRQIPC